MKASFSNENLDEEDLPIFPGTKTYFTWNVKVKDKEKTDKEKAQKFNLFETEAQTQTEIDENNNNKGNMPSLMKKLSQEISKFESPLKTNPILEPNYTRRVIKEPHPQPVFETYSTVLVNKKQRQIEIDQNGKKDFKRRQENSTFNSNNKVPVINLDTIEQWAMTEREEEEFTFFWGIKNFSAFFTSKDSFFSPMFKGGPKSNHSWQLKLAPNKKTKKIQGIYLILKQFGDFDTTIGRKIGVRFQFILLDLNDKPKIQTPEYYVNQFKLGKELGYSKIIEDVDTKDPLKILCKIWIQGELLHHFKDDFKNVQINNFYKSLQSIEEDLNGENNLASSASLKDSESSKSQFENDEINNNNNQNLNFLSEHYQKALSNGAFADLTIIAPKKTFMVHKIILASQSPIFHVMLMSTNNIDKKKKKKQKPAEILVDFDTDIVEGMLEFIYSGKTRFLPEKTEELYEIADKYCLQTLKNACERERAFSQLRRQYPDYGADSKNEGINNFK